MRSPASREIDACHHWLEVELAEVAPRVVVTQYSLFRGDDWWRSRTTAREGLVEIEKLAEDYLLHPWQRAEPRTQR